MSIDLPLVDTALAAGVPADAVIPFGRDRAKIDYRWVEKVGAQPGRLVLVTAMSPTPAGEGKTTTSIGLADGLRYLGKRAVLALREPSLGPVFGLKGGAIGGGRATLTPAASINLHFNGDFAAIAAAHNLLAAMADNAVYFDTHDIDPATVSVRRVIDMNDRALRAILLSPSGRLDSAGPGAGTRSNPGAHATRATGFDIVPASEVMAAFCLASSFADLRERLNAMEVARTRAGVPVTAADLGATGAMLALLAEAFCPNLVATREGTPALVHGGPFANIAHGCNSVMATRAALAMGEIAVTEAGFGADLGAEKFIDIMCRTSGLRPDAAVFVVTLRALRYHGGIANAARHIHNLQAVWGQSVVVALNRFDTDTEADIEKVRTQFEELGVPVAVSEHFARGGEGAAPLAEAVLGALETPSRTRFTYPDSASLSEKITAVVRRVYGGASVTFAQEAREQLRELEERSYGSYPVCIAKTPASFTTDPKRLGAPSDFDVPVRDVHLSAGGRFVVVMAGSVMLMPGLPKEPSALAIDVDAAGNVRGIH
ncbi:formate--tetrahydrofolate ligase [Actinotignum sp. GS-2025a]|uniref:formate--tetrahydrofolate ligase n=1 Tax=Actinotignum TaxID=1653174 RepID=UPI000F7DC862|nr:formate--tetrahydrofolate ligase [Actinotignum sanguinis]MDY5147896.1 formate--tetrahydrofolate ligase [Actinotignum sanguinis]RTE48322.1 formate--tetrahydrofolate ligase [Actinotignum sanguinis]